MSFSASSSSFSLHIKGAKGYMAFRVAHGHQQGRPITPAFGCLYCDNVCIVLVNYERFDRHHTNT